MYTVYYDHETNAHSIIKDELIEIIHEKDVIIHQGTLEECKTYLEPVTVIYQTIDYKDSIPTEDEGPE